MSRDLFNSERDELEKLVDTASLQAVLEALSEICGLKAEHLCANWQDSLQARLWAQAEGRIGITATHKDIEAVS